VDAVLLDGAGNVDEIFVDHRNERDVMFCSEVLKDLVERLDVVRAIVGRQGNAGEQGLDVSGFESGEYGVQVFASLIGRQTAKAVVAAEFNDDNCRMSLNDGADIGDRVFSSSAARAAVLDLVFIAALVEIALERIRKGLAGLESVARGDAVAVADDGWAVGGEQGKSSKYQANGNEKATLYVHMISVKVCKGRNVLCAGCVRMKVWRRED